MLKCFKKISVLVTITIVLSQSAVFGATNKPSNESIYKNTALQLIKGMKSNKIIEGNIPLYNTKDVESEALFDLNNGYIIVDKATNTVSEFNLTKDNKYFNRTDEHYVYGGPTESFKEKDNKLIDLSTYKEEKNKLKIEESLDIFKKNTKSNTQTITANAATLTANAATLNEIDIAGTIPNLAYNPNGICGSCAVGNFLTFLSWNVSSPFVPQQYQSSGTNFIKSIVPYIEGQASVNPNYTSPGSTPSQLQTGLNNYLSNVVGYTGKAALFDGQADPVRVTGITNHGLPFVLGLHSGDSSNPYGNHWVVGIGYVYIPLNQSMPLYYKVINGWGNNDVYVNKAWSDAVVYLQLY